MRKSLRAASKKGLAGLLCAAVAFLGPGLDGWSVVWADGPSGTHKVFDPDAKRMVDVKDASVSETINLIRSNPNLAPQERDRAIDYLKRMEPVMGKSPELLNDLRDLQSGLQNLQSDQSAGLALTHFYTNSASEADRLDQMHLQQEVLSSNGNYRHVQTRNSALGVITQDVVVQRVGPDFQSFIVRQPDPKNLQSLVIEQLGFTYNDSGQEKQKVSYSRSFNKMIHMVVRIFYRRNDLQDLLDDPNTPEPAKVKLRAQLKDIQDHFPRDIIDFDSEMQAMQADVDGGKTYSPDELRQKAERLKNMQQRVLAFYNNNQLDMLQKTMLAQFVYYFTSVSGMSYNPFDKKDDTGVDITRMKKEDVEKILQGFEKGNVPGSGLVPWLASWSDMKPARELENKLPPEFKDAATLKAIAAEAIQFLGFAADAQKRLFDSDAKKLEAGIFKEGLSDEERQAIMGEMDRWVRLAQLQIQRFQVQTMAVEVWRLKNDKLKGDMGIGDNAAQVVEAQRLLDQAEQQLIPEMEGLQKKSTQSMIEETVYAFMNALQRARFTTREQPILTEDLKELIAQSSQLKALYLAKQFDIFANDKVLQDALGNVEGNLYQEFLKPENQKEDVRRALQLFEQLTGALGALYDGKAGVSGVKEGLAPLQGKFDELIKLLGMANGPPTADSLKKTQTSLKVYQSNLSGILQNFTSNMQTFDMLNQLDLYAKKMLSSQTQKSDKWYEFKWLDNLLNIGGGRDAAGEQGVKVWNYKAWQVLFQQKDVREQALALIAKGDYAGANDMLAKLDPEMTAKTLARLARDKQDQDAGLDIVGMLTQGLQNDSAAVAQANINSAFKLLPDAVKGFMGGTMIYDMAAMTILTAGLGGVFAGAAKMIGEGAKALAAIMRVASASAMFERLGMMGRMVASALRFGAKVLEFTSKVFLNISRNIQVTLGLPTQLTEGTVRAMSVRGASSILMKSAWFQIKMATTMAAASSLMAMGMHGWSNATAPGSSSYKSYGDAAAQGALGGAAFGAKTGFLMLLNPLPTEAMGTTGAIGRVRALGESAGPMEALSKAFGRMFAGADAASMAKMGLWRQWGSYVEAIRPGTGMMGLATGSGRQLAKLALTAGGFADGALKYFLVAEGSKEIVRDAAYGINAAFGGSDADFGGSAHMNAYIMSTGWGEMAQQTSWLLLPQAPHQDASAMDQYKETMRGLRTLDGAGELTKLFSPEVGATGEIKVDRPFWGMTIGEKLSFGFGRLGQLFGGKAPERPKDTIKVTPDIYLEAFRRISQDTRSGKVRMPELLAMSSAGDEHLNSLRSMEDVMRDVFADKTASKPAPVTVDAAGQQKVLDQALNDPNSPAARRQLREILLMPALRGEADQAIRKRLASEPDLLKGVYDQVKNYDKGDAKARENGIVLDGQRILNPTVIENLRNTAYWVIIEKAPGIGPNLLKRLGGAVGTKSVTSNADRITDRLVDAIDVSARAAEKNGRQLSIDEIKDLTKTTLSEIIKSVGEGPEKEMFRKALEHHSPSFEGGALDRYNGESFARDAMSGRLMGKANESARIARINLYADIAVEALKIHQIDAKGTTIKNYKEIQTKMAKEFLTLLATEKDANTTLKAFLMAHTGAGKSILAMVLLMPIIRGVAKEAKLDGVDFNTHGELLRAQAQADYAGYFKGKLPDFRIQTLSDLAAEHLTRKAQNGLSPLQRRFQIYDEFDQLFLDPPTSLGKDQGSISMDSPLYKAHVELKNAVDRLRLEHNLSADEMTAELKNPNSPIAAEMQTIQTDFAKNLRTALAESTPWFGGDAQTKKEAKNFRNVVEGAQRFSFSIDGYSRAMAEDFYKTAAVLDPSEIVMQNPNKGGKPLQIHGGSQVYTDLDTGGQRTYFEIQQGAKITNPFENLEMTNAGDVVRSTRYMVALSGTLPEALRQVLVDADVKIRGDGTRTADGKYMIAAGRDAALNAMADGIAEHALSGDDKLSVGVINTPGELQRVGELLEKRGIKPEQIVRYSVGDTFKSEKLFRADEVRQNQNLKALQDGSAKVVLLTVGASRGLDMPLKKYGEVHMYGLDPQKTSLVNFTQGQGRIDPDRLGDKATREFFYFTDAGSLAGDPVFREIAQPLIEKARSGVETGMISRIAGGARDYWQTKKGQDEAPEGFETMTDAQIVDHLLGSVTEKYHETLLDIRLEDLVRRNGGKFAGEKQWKEIADRVRPEAQRLADADFARMSREEILQRGLEDPASMPDLETLGAARDLVLSRRIRETFGADLAKLGEDPALRQKIMEDPRFFDLVLRNVQRRVEYNALNSSMIFQKEPMFKPETLPTMGVVALGLAGGVVSAITLAHMLPTIAALGVLNPAWSWLGGYTPGWLIGNPVLHEPLMTLAIWFSLRMTTRQTFVKKPKPYGQAGGGKNPDAAPKPAGPPPLPGADEDSGDDDGNGAPSGTSVPDPNLAPPPVTAPK